VRAVHQAFQVRFVAADEPGRDQVLEHRLRARIAEMAEALAPALKTVRRLDPGHQGFVDQPGVGVQSRAHALARPARIEGHADAEDVDGFDGHGSGSWS